MSKRKTMDEWMFALAVYSGFNALDRYSLYLELLETYINKVGEKKITLPKAASTKKIEKLSEKKKASFASFLLDFDAKAEMDKYKAQNISWKYIYAPDYPVLLSEIFAPPVVLFYQGDFELLDNYTWLGIVGARACSDYGLEVVEKLVQELVEQAGEKLGIVSGLAKGIDTKAHQETLKHQGKTVAVIGCGLDYFYPLTNKELQTEIAQKQLVLTEYPLGAKPLKFHFPERNRIIAGLSRGVLVVEAKKSSGSLITAYNALEENRDVFAVPGSIFEKTTEGCHKLIQLGAVLTKNSSDILKEWHLI